MRTPPPPPPCVRELSALYPVEKQKFMLEMIKVPKREMRLKGMLFKQLLQARQDDMRSMAGLINSACLDVRLSRRLKKLLGIILKLGNQLNEVPTTLLLLLLSTAAVSVGDWREVKVVAAAAAAAATGVGASTRFCCW